MLKYDIKQAPVNTVIVEVGATLDDTVTYGSLTLNIDPEFNPTQYARIYGRVIAVPEGKAYATNELEIEKDVQVGDIIYFHYLTTTDETNCIHGNYFKVPYYWIFCAVRDNAIIPIGSWALCEKIVEEAFNEVEVNGVKIQATLSQSGLVTGVAKKPSVKYAKLVHIGKPLIGVNALDANAGDVVILEKNSNFVNIIEGKEYYTLQQEYILGTKSNAY
jgi:co-chaperonin GroES (HSP10)